MRKTRLLIRVFLYSPDYIYIPSRNYNTKTVRIKTIDWMLAIFSWDISRLVIMCYYDIAYIIRSERSMVCKYLFIISFFFCSSFFSISSPTVTVTHVWVKENKISITQISNRTFSYCRSFFEWPPNTYNNVCILLLAYKMHQADKSVACRIFFILLN